MAVARRKAVAQQFDSEQVKEQGTQVWDNFRAGSPDIEEGMHEAEPWIGGVPAVNGLSWRREHEAEKHAKKTREVEGIQDQWTFELVRGDVEDRHFGYHERIFGPSRSDHVP
ncbi:hypothetical protein HO173_005237 [Letharia columbiana]|uniref:Uncharacterized protein n=1 Tax=Letharia columbiana TaxID=112416 RepID=A0A8H6FX55_9LECA|nr:uncharacterized protein HO173_005237 [Letharia columbiana]KAF6236456.1 hypothetical protein HO173_005237 [Letharia columbiana]